MTKYLLITENRAPMLFTVYACASLYKTIYGGELSIMCEGEFRKVY